MQSTLGSWKICFLGNAGAGKSSILYRLLMKASPPDPFNPTMMAHSAQVKFSSARIKTPCALDIWDTCGEEKFMSLQKCYYNNTNAVLITCAALDVRALLDVQKWVNELRNNANPELCMIVCSKIDAIKDDRTNVISVQTYARSNSIPFHLVSAKCDIGIENLFEDICIRLSELALVRSSLPSAYPATPIQLVCDGYDRTTTQRPPPKKGKRLC